MRIGRATKEAARGVTALCCQYQCLDGYSILYLTILLGWNGSSQWFPTGYAILSSPCSFVSPYLTCDIILRASVYHRTLLRFFIGSFLRFLSVYCHYIIHPVMHYIQQIRIREIKFFHFKSNFYSAWYLWSYGQFLLLVMERKCY